MASKKRSRATLASVTFDAGLRSALVNLPIALYGPLLERGVPPQSIVVEMVRSDSEGAEVVTEDLSLSANNIDKAYVGWSGMSAAPLTASSGAFSSTSNGSATSVVSMSATLASTFSPPLAESSYVRITLLRSPPLPTAKRIDVVPLTADDWEILSLNADEVENNMLGQVRAARSGMTIAVHVGRQGRTVCRFRVESSDPPTQGLSPASDDGATETGGLARAVRLSTDTEVVIAPRSRLSAPVAPPADEPEEVKFDAAGPSQSAKGVGTPLQAQHFLNHSPFRVLPAHVRPASVLSAAPVTLHSDDANVLATAFGAAGRCTITKMPCPAAPQVFADAGAQTKEASTRRATTSDSDGNAATPSTASSVPARATTSTSFGAATGPPWLPRRQVYVDEALRARLGLRDFDLVRFSSASPAATAAAAATATPSRPTSPQGREAQLPASTAPVLAGYDAVLDTCTGAIENAFRARRWRTLRASLEGQSNGRLSTCNAGLLLTGASGAGKTSVARVVAERLASSSLLIATIHIDCTPFAEERLSAMRALIDGWLASAIWHSPTVLVLDNLDRIVPADQEHVDSPRNAHVAESLMQRIQQAAAQYAVFVVATAQSNMSINKVCLAHHVFGETVELKAPSKEARRDILAYLVGQRTHLHAVELNFGTLAGQTEGYMPADLRDLVERTVHQSAVRSMQALDGAAGDGRTTLTMDDFEQAQKGFTPLSLRDIQLTQSATRWSDIGGLQETRRVLRETLEWPTKYARVFAQCPLRLRSGLLLYGYPGCGKTLLAGAVARECGLNFISVKGPEILNKYIGASEKSVRDLFDRAQAAKPCVLFFDEFDSIAPKRGHDSTGVTDRVVNQLLTQMDGAEGLSGVYVLAATSRPDLIDSALLRPGRLDKSLLCDLPSKEDRLDILNVLCGSNRVRLADDVDLHAWAQRTEGFSGADLQALVYNANLEAIHEGMNARAKKDDEEGGGANGSGGGGGGGDDASHVRFVRFGGEKATQSTTLSGAERLALQRRMALILGNTNQRRDAETFNAAPSGAVASASPSVALVTEAQLQKCLRTTRQSVPREEQQRLRAIYQQFVGDRSGEFPNGEASREVGARQSLM